MRDELRTRHGAAGRASIVARAPALTWLPAIARASAAMFVHILAAASAFPDGSDISFHRNEFPTASLLGIGGFYLWWMSAPLIAFHRAASASRPDAATSKGQLALHTARIALTTTGVYGLSVYIVLKNLATLAIPTEVRTVLPAVALGCFYGARAVLARTRQLSQPHGRD